MNKKYFVALVILSFFNVQCLKKPGSGVKASVELKGQIFVIQNNRLNVKLGGVEVYFVPLDVFRERCRWIALNQGKAKQIGLYRERLDRIDRELANASRQDYSKQISGFLTTAKSFQEASWSQFQGSPIVADYLRLSELQKENSDIFKASEFASYPDQQWALTSLLFEWLPTAQTAQSPTDADGNYSLKVPVPARGFLIAQSSRQLDGGSFEHYFWIHEVSEDVATPIHLTSNTLLKPKDFAGMIRQSSEMPRTSMKLVADELGLRNLDWFGEAESLLRDVATNQNKIDNFKDKIRGLERKIDDIRILSDP